MLELVLGKSGLKKTTSGCVNNVNLTTLGPSTSNLKPFK